MGSRNVKRVYEEWTHLGHREARALGYMAVTALDDATPPVYFGGWEAIARAVGLDPEWKHESAKTAVKQIMSALTKAGAAVSNGEGRKDSRAEYALTLDPAETVSFWVIRKRGEYARTVWDAVARERYAPPVRPKQGERIIHPEGQGE